MGLGRRVWMMGYEGGMVGRGGGKQGSAEHTLWVF